MKRIWILGLWLIIVSSACLFAIAREQATVLPDDPLSTAPLALRWSAPFEFDNTGPFQLEDNSDRIYLMLWIGNTGGEPVNIRKAHLDVGEVGSSHAWGMGLVYWWPGEQSWWDRDDPCRWAIQGHGEYRVAPESVTWTIQPGQWRRLANVLIDPRCWPGHEWPCEEPIEVYCAPQHDTYNVCGTWITEWYTPDFPLCPGENLVGDYGNTIVILPPEE